MARQRRDEPRAELRREEPHGTDDRLAVRKARVTLAAEDQ